MKIVLIKLAIFAGLAAIFPMIADTVLGGRKSAGIVLMYFGGLLLLVWAEEIEQRASSEMPVGRYRLIGGCCGLGRRYGS